MNSSNLLNKGFKKCACLKYFSLCLDSGFVPELFKKIRGCKTLFEEVSISVFIAISE